MATGTTLSAAISLGAPLGRLAILSAILIVLPLSFPNPFFFDVAVKVGLSAIVCVGLNLLSGYAGQISLGHAGFFALGAYGTALLSIKLGVHGLIAAPVIATVVGLLAHVIARPILKLKGHYLAMATLGLGIIISIVLNREIWLTGGPDGLSVPAMRLGEFKLRAIEFWYWIVAAFLIVAVWLAENLVNSPAGRSLRALHSSEIAAATAGVDVPRAKALVFAFSAVLASIAGAFFVFAERFITPADAGFLRSVEFLTMIVFGGLGSTYGALVGAAILTALPQLVAAFAEYKHVAIGIVLIATMIFMPRGIVPTLADLFGRRVGR
ncbi:branched-chain amino acid ABC transporter permease [Tardiphaga robiniae]|uniref:branched-chain amino acid ABC transporter permease n=1 Tax=Tardiphaga robiniae TaxID=943830 RepID=UPI001586228B|nr:branched-chain amino acid ABC transporter permease [Tardiphaga robiniae]NUU42583.1 branched-chain amino acid ABC transporter permease [Tardiphaga robiniae]